MIENIALCLQHQNLPYASGVAYGIHRIILKHNCQHLIRFPTNTAATGITTTQAIAPNIIDTQF